MTDPTLEEAKLIVASLQASLQAYQPAVDIEVTNFREGDRAAVLVVGNVNFRVEIPMTEETLRQFKERVDSAVEEMSGPLVVKSNLIVPPT